MSNVNLINKIILGDCLEVMRGIDDKSVQLVLCDLPFGITSNKWDCLIDLKLLWGEYLRIGKDNCIYALNSCQPFTSILTLSNLEMWRHEWVWIKNRGSNFANTVREPFKEHETIQIFSKGKWIYNKQMQERTGMGKDRVKYKLNQRSKSENYREFEGREETKQGDLRVPSSWQKWNTDTSGFHPTIKPLEMGNYFIKTYSNEGDLILDNSCGSGTYCLAAKSLNRQFIGIEKEEKYFNIAKERLNLC